jgi:hypothetical protein
LPIKPVPQLAESPTLQLEPSATVLLALLATQPTQLLVLPIRPVPQQVE